VNRRELLKLSSAVLLPGALTPKGGDAQAAARPVERWGIFELILDGPSTGNPFIDVTFGARFTFQNRKLICDGFYDGDGKYKVRFMPDEPGTWSFVTESNQPALTGRTGTFECTVAREGNHGPVRVRDGFHFGYEDGTPYVECGTTCYAWAFQSDALQRQTIETLKISPFDKLRMCIFPKWYQYNRSEPPIYPFPRNGDTNDFSSFNASYFRHFDELIAQLCEIGVQADLILFHPYDKWGYSSMPADVDDRYLRYVVARYAAYRNLWWSLANEFDLLKAKDNSDWDRFGRIVTESDPYGHLRSIHYSRVMYDYSRAWCTHAGVQSRAFESASDWRADWGKPVVFDECQYEGNIPTNWGSITGDELAHRFWAATARGAYCGHGETYLDPQDVLWWSKGGVLHGSSPAQIAFLRKLLEETIAVGPGPIGFAFDLASLGTRAKRANNYVLFVYFDVHAPAEFTIDLPAGFTYRAEYVDALKMTRSPLGDSFAGHADIKLPSSPYGSVWFHMVSNT
jgi:hypothetical protein